ncbi:flavin reductase family protein [Virgibacillus necropolis]|uniref:flavin reductase family protein n=1 Tax=Virgibacillus necropolis TaxID=163877 RepID=UPI00384CC3DA
MDVKELRNCMGSFATGVTVITWNDDNGHRKGITVNSFTSVSLDPALALISVDKNASACKVLENRSFVINVLSAAQETYAWQFAGKPQEDLVVEWENDSEIGPILKNTIATIECMPWAEYEGGDHMLFVGEIMNFSYRNNDGLLFFKGKCLKTERNQRVGN